VIDLRRQIDAVWRGLPGPKLLRWASVFFTLFALSLLFSVAVSQIFLSCAGVCYAIDLVRHPRVPKFPPIKLPLILFCFFTLISIFWAENPAVGWTAVRKLTLFLIVLLAVNLVAGLPQLTFIYGAMFVESALAGLVAVAQFVLQYRQMSAEHPGQFYYYMTLMRIHGFMGHWMTFGGQQMLVFIALAAYVLGARNAPAESRHPAEAGAGQLQTPKASRPALLGWILLAIVFVSLVLNFTRGVWLGCALALLYLIARWRARLLWTLPVAALAIYLAAPSLLRERLKTLLHPTSDPAITVRFEMWHVGLAMIRRHPLVGVGPNNVNEVYLAYLPRGVVPVAAWHEHLHDVYLQLAAERGLPCFAAWLWMMAAWGSKIYRIRRRLAREGRASGIWIADACFAGWLAFMAEGWFEFNFGTTPVLMVFLLLMSTPFILPEPAAIGFDEKRPHA
jgi:putative inorganic carbon (HCO3(-)) transporter